MLKNTLFLEKLPISFDIDFPFGTLSSRMNQPCQAFAALHNGAGKGGVAGVHARAARLVALISAKVGGALIAGWTVGYCHKTGTRLPFLFLVVAAVLNDAGASFHGMRCCRCLASTTELHTHIHNTKLAYHACVYNNFPYARFYSSNAHLYHCVTTSLRAQQRIDLHCFHSRTLRVHACINYTSSLRALQHIPLD